MEPFNDEGGVNWALLKGLSERFPARAIEQREGAYGKMLDYVATETVIRRLNRVAGAWSFRRTGHEWTDPVSWTDKKTGEIRTSRTLIVFGEMTMPGLGTRSGIGVQVIEHGRGNEDMLKGALSDCLKNCAKEFGVGIDLYGPDLEAQETNGDQVDSPIDFASTRGRRMAAAETNGRNGGSPGGPQPATPRQLKFIQAIAREHGMADDELNAEVEQLYGRPVAQLDRRDASAFIERLQSRARSFGDGHDGN